MVLVLISSKVQASVVGSDVLLAQISKGHAYMQVEKIINIAGKDAIGKHKKIIVNITALNKNSQIDLCNALE